MPPECNIVGGKILFYFRDKGDAHSKEAGEELNDKTPNQLYN